MSAINGETLIFGQKSGDDVQLVVNGDEFYARYETPEGYSVGYDLNKGLYCYLDLLDGRFMSTGVSMHKNPPYGLRRHTRESSRIRNQVFKSRYEALRVPEPVGETMVTRTMGINDGLLSGRQVSSGSVRGLTILVEFQDVSSYVKKEDVELLLNSDSNNIFGNYCSVRKYYQLMSNGKLNYFNDVVGPVKLSQKQSYYINNSLMEEALDLAISQFNINLKDYDSRGENIVDALSFLYSGRTLYKNWLWPHNSKLNIRRQGVKLNYYTIQSMGRHAVDLSIGTFTHETGHMLCRFPDLYDYGQRDGDFEKSSGLGSYCLMSSGNHLGRGKTPSPLSAYLRDLVNWCDNKVDLNVNGQYTITHGDYNTLMRFRTNNPYEYFLLENRSRLGLDKYLTDEGLAIYHCDRKGSNEYEDGTLDKHYQCALLQADGHLDLENNFNSGDVGDLYKTLNGIVLNNLTKPSSRQWDGTDSGLIIRNVVNNGEKISFETGKAMSQENSLILSLSPDLLIPDNDNNGITSVIKVEKKAKLKNLCVKVEVSHTYSGDLKISLESPEGLKIPLHSNEGGSQDNISLSLCSKDDAKLQALKGKNITGEWKLNIIDSAQADIGRLDFWEIKIEIEELDEILRFQNSEKVEIPDNNANGVNDFINVSKVKVINAIEVYIKIKHSYVGDLQIDLLSPSGTKVNLRVPNGSSDDDLEQSFSIENTPALSLFHEENTSGKWTLNVKDVANLDVGSLEEWGIVFRVV